MMRSIDIILPIAGSLALSSVAVRQQRNAPPASNSPSLASENGADKAWSFSASVYTYHRAGRPRLCATHRYVRPRLAPSRSPLQL